MLRIHHIHICHCHRPIIFPPTRRHRISAYSWKPNQTKPNEAHHRRVRGSFCVLPFLFGCLRQNASRQSLSETCWIKSCVYTARQRERRRHRWRYFVTPTNGMGADRGGRAVGWGRHCDEEWCLWQFVKHSLELIIWRIYFTMRVHVVTNAVVPRYSGATRPHGIHSILDRHHAPDSHIIHIRELLHRIFSLLAPAKEKPIIFFCKKNNYWELNIATCPQYVNCAKDARMNVYVVRVLPTYGCVCVRSVLPPRCWIIKCRRTVKRLTGWLGMANGNSLSLCPSHPLAVLSQNE